MSRRWDRGTPCLACCTRIRKALVVKPNEGTSGRSVFRVTSEAELDYAASEIFSSHLSLAISPYVEIEEEVRVILLDDVPHAVYRKQRGSDWRHNLDFGARPILLERGEAHDASVAHRDRGREGDRHPLRVGRRGSRWRRVEGARNQFGRDDGGAGQASSRAGRRRRTTRRWTRCSSKFPLSSRTSERDPRPITTGAHWFAR